MKPSVIYVFLLISMLVMSCGNEKKASEVASYVYEEKSPVPVSGDILIPGDWVKKDVVCYGLVVSIDTAGHPRSGKPVKARVIDFRNNGIEMKSLENVSLVRLKGCTKMGISLGETWVEKEGELFATREEAENYLKKKNLLME